MAVCSICNAQFTFFENLTNRGIQRCKACDTRFKQHQQGALQAIEFAFFQRNGVPAQMEQDIYRQFNEAHMPQDLAQPVLSRLQYLRNLTEIRYGNVPRIATSIHLDSDEYAHFEWRVIYFKPNKNIKQVPGRLIGTNKKCYFISDTGADSANIDWNNVGEVSERSVRLTNTVRQNGKTYTTYQDVQTLHISVSKGSGGGGYSVPDILYGQIIINTLVRMWKRQLVVWAENKTHGAVPEHVQVQVRQRDRNRCVQCGYEGPYLEFDHIIPRSKSGPNTVENIQLLCRMCNLKKGDKL